MILREKKYGKQVRVEEGEANIKNVHVKEYILGKNRNFTDLPANKSMTLDSLEVS